MSKITLTNLVNLQNETTAVNAINTNNATLQTALDNTLSRDGTIPNTMGANLDMNNNQILNLPAPAGAASPVRLQDVTSPATIASVPPVGTSGAVVGLLNSNKTDSGNNTFSGTNAFNGVATLQSPVLVTPNLGTPSAAVLTNATSLPLASVNSLGTGVATFLTTPTSANLKTALTDETGSGQAVFATSPTLVTPTLGAATATSITTTGVGNFFSATAVPPNGTTGTGITMSSTSNLGIFFGSGNPSLSAAQGSIYINTTGSGTANRLFINNNGAAAWSAVSTTT
jgi:hypothetical protein